MSEATMITILKGMLCLVVLVGLLAVWWAIWMLWTSVLSSAWPEGPAGLVNPGYWLFVGEWLLLIGFLHLLRRLFRK